MEKVHAPEIFACTAAPDLASGNALSNNATHRILDFTTALLEH